MSLSLIGLLSSANIHFYLYPKVDMKPVTKTLPEVREKAKHLCIIVDQIRKLKANLGTLSDEVAASLEEGTYLIDGFAFVVEMHDRKKVVKGITKVVEL